MSYYFWQQQAKYISAKSCTCSNEKYLQATFDIGKCGEMSFQKSDAKQSKKIAKNGTCNSTDVLQKK
jgi:hypothetical protein